MLEKFRKARPVIGIDRSGKARMIEAIIIDYAGRLIENRRILDIGCGNGGISAHFAQHNEVYGVDVKDRRAPENAPLFAFRFVESEELPFPDQFFDIVLSHHVIEHVDDQNRHLREILRVLKPNGFCYLATPNKSSPIMKGHVGNDRVLKYSEMSPLFERNGFDTLEYATHVLRQPARFHGEIRAGRFVPAPLVKQLRPLFPSHMFVLRPTSV